jgi:hypothetical protein
MQAVPLEKTLRLTMSARWLIAADFVGSGVASSSVFLNWTLRVQISIILSKTPINIDLQCACLQYGCPLLGKDILSSGKTGHLISLGSHTDEAAWRKHSVRTRTIYAQMFKRSLRQRMAAFWLQISPGASIDKRVFRITWQVNSSASKTHKRRSKTQETRGKYRSGHSILSSKPSSRKTT